MASQVANEHAETRGQDTKNEVFWQIVSELMSHTFGSRCAAGGTALFLSAVGYDVIDASSVIQDIAA